MHAQEIKSNQLASLLCPILGCSSMFGGIAVAGSHFLFALTMHVGLVLRCHQAMFVDFGMARQYDGVCLLRFDDTNPEAEKQVGNCL